MRLDSNNQPKEACIGCCFATRLSACKSLPRHSMASKMGLYPRHVQSNFVKNC